MTRKKPAPARKPPRAKPKPSQKPAPPTPEQIKAKLAALDALRRKVKAAAGPAPEPEKSKRRPRFSGSWGCGK